MPSEVGPSYALGRLPRFPEKLRELTYPHVESFNYFLDEVFFVTPLFTHSSSVSVYAMRSFDH